MAVQIPLSEAARAPELDTDHGVHEIAENLAYKRLSIVNVVFYGLPGAGDRNWILIDAGIPGSYGNIRGAAEARFGKDARPAAIILTHGHFDHVGALERLASHWNVPVFAHPLEHPYLNGTESYPPPDPAADGGIMAKLSPLFPRAPVNVSANLHQLWPDGTIPPMPGWRWLHTPGHAPGHVSLWHEGTRTLIAGDAIVTTGQESAYEVMVQEPEMHGPPRYFTPDWAAAEASVRSLAALQPELVITGHGRAMAGPEMRQALVDLAGRFRSVAVPEHLQRID